MSRNSDRLSQLYEKQVDRTMYLAELFGSAIGRLRMASLMTNDKFVREYLEDGIKDLEERFYKRDETPKS